MLSQYDSVVCLAVAYSVEDVIYEWRFGSGKSVEITDGMTLSQFDLLQTPSYNRTEMFKGGEGHVLTYIV